MWTMPTLEPIVAAEPGWRARLELEFRQRGGATFLARRGHVGPLLVQRPFFPEPNVCHVYVVHPPGGIVGGDDLTIQVRTLAGAHALVTTPAATKFYRCERKEAIQRQHLAVGAAAFEWLPQETIFYPGAAARSETIVRLQSDSRFIGWEMPCLGLPARGERFDRGRLSLDLELWIDEEPRLIERLRLEGASPARSARWGFAGHEAIGTLLAYPANAALLAAVRALSSEGLEVAATCVDEVLVCRCLGAQGEQVKRTLIAAWQSIRPLVLGRGAVSPRIWAT